MSATRRSPMRLSIISLRALTRAALLAVVGVALASAVQSDSVSAAVDTPTQVRFSILSTCNNGGAPQWNGFVGGVAAGSVNPTTDCSCAASLKTITSTDPAVLAAVGAPACTELSISLTGGSTYLAWARAEITRSETGVETTCLFDQNGGSCNVSDLCNAGYENKVPGFAAGNNLPNSDGDAQPNCSDPDIDGDGVDNGADLCPLVADGANGDSDGDGIGNACEPLTVRTVPWLGLPNKAHEVYSGGSIVLQGTATNGYTDTPAANIGSAVWDPGDGSAVQSVSFANPLAIELTKTYTGSDGQPFVATLTVTNAAGDVATDTFRIVVKTRTIDVEANMAIDKGLWYLHKQITRSTVENVKIGTISHSNHNTTAAHIATTAGAVQAMQINNHVTDGQVAQDPYIHGVDRMLRWLETQLATQTLNTQNGNNPDANGNSLGIYPNDPSVVNYVTGQVMDAFVSSGTPSRRAMLGVGDVRGREYSALVQDMMDYNNWSQIDTGVGRGSWHYTLSNNSASGHDDNSIAQWPAIGGIAGERVWSLTTPAWVKTDVLSFLPNTYNAGGSNGALSYTGAFGYSTQNNLPWSEGFATTPSALIQYIWAGVAKDSTPDNDPETRVRDGFRYVARYHRVRNNYPCCDTTGHINGINFYALYATTKAYRLALNEAGTPEPVTMVDDDPADAVPAWHWYYNDPPAGAPAAAGPVGVARAVIAHQQANGQFPGTYLWTGNMATAWGVIILSPSLFQLGPTASCTANPSEIGTGGGTVNFNASSSSHNDDDGVIVSYVWDFDDGTAPGAGVTTSHTYGPGTTFPRTFNATVTVTDENGLTDTATCAVTQVDTNVAPDADAGGPYTFCMGSPMILDGSGSADAEDGEPSSWLWDWTSPTNFTPPNAAGETFDATAQFTALGPGTYDLGLRVADSFGVANDEFTTVTVLAANAPGCNQAPVANNDA